jgi:hypothetical protein
MQSHLLWPPPVHPPPSRPTQIAAASSSFRCQFASPRRAGASIFPSLVVAAPWTGKGGALI